MNNNHSDKSIVAENKHKIIDIFGELLEVSTHLILYLVGVYPMGIYSLWNIKKFIYAYSFYSLKISNLYILCEKYYLYKDFFEKREKYGTPVMMSRHPQLNGYIYDVIISLKEYLEKDLIENIYILIINSQNKPVKRFVFTVKDLVQNNYNQEINFVEITHLFRTTIKKLWGCSNLDDTTDVDDDLLFQYMVKLKGDGESGDSSENSRFPWVLAEDEYLTPIQRKEEKKVSDGHYKDGEKEKMDEDEDEDNMDLAIDHDDNDDVKTSELLSIYSINNPSIKLQLYQEILPL
ncbi:hypothetical protein BCR36DRAFT_410780 [Piromyces finnis]|uniref:HORMA domain-containing protein n=1 Tax=Piromyces finnis TaxID=1754191 RepID=A0A1Y1VEG9_9FUNG|nr:hypothetical protein BCR36DRAFT_410780 [Piromyces finnis]|eukprot:ORX54236.1 hypothetical protein BCR36DRAFT_410780 [Piromyces finnis]